MPRLVLDTNVLVSAFLFYPGTSFRPSFYKMPELEGVLTAMRERRIDTATLRA